MQLFQILLLALLCSLSIFMHILACALWQNWFPAITCAPPLLARRDKAICDDPLHPFALGRNLRSIIKPAPDQLAVLAGLRAIAVLWVVAVHCCQFVGIEWEWDAGRGGFFWRSGTARQLLWASWPMQVFLQGDLGVDVFFVLSGFLI